MEEEQVSMIKKIIDHRIEQRNIMIKAKLFKLHSILKKLYGNIEYIELKFEDIIDSSFRDKDNQIFNEYLLDYIYNDLIKKNIIM